MFKPFWDATTVLSHRLPLLAMAGPVPSTQDQHEIDRMLSEKVGAAAGGMVNAQLEMNHCLMKISFKAALGQNVFWEIQKLPQQIITAATAPTEKTLHANAQRLRP